MRNQILGVFNPRRADHVWLAINAIPRLSPGDHRPSAVFVTLHDVTVQKRAEQAVRESEARLREAKRIAGLGHWEWDLRTDHHHWSEEIYRCYGRDPALPPATYPEVQQYFTPASWARLAETVERAIAEGKAYACDAEVVRPNGSHRWITARGEAVFEDGGKPALLRGTVQDITARKRAEEALRTSEERQAFLLALGNALRPLADPLDIQAEAARRLGEQLNVNRCVYAEMAGEEATILREYVDGVPSLPVRFLLTTFGEEPIAACRRGGIVAVAEVATDPRLTDAERANLKAAQIAAFMVVTPIKAGQPLAAFSAQSAAPRRWTSSDLWLFGEVAERTWAAVERTRAEQALREADRRKDEFLATFSARPPEPAVSHRRILVIDDNQDVANSLALVLRLRPPPPKGRERPAADAHPRVGCGGCHLPRSCAALQDRRSRTKLMELSSVGRNSKCAPLISTKPRPTCRG